jgi:hypothetical protein
VLAAAAFAVPVHLVAAVLAGQRDVGAAAVEIVDGEVVAYAQRLRQRPHGGAVAEQVVVVDVRHRHGAQQVQQGVPLVRQIELHRPPLGKRGVAVLGLDQTQHHVLLRPAGCKDRNRASSARCAASSSTWRSVPPPRVMNRQDHGLAAAVGGAQPVDRQPRGACRVGLHEITHLGFVAGVQAAQGVHGGELARALAVAEAHATGVAHVGIQRMEVDPAQVDGALAKSFSSP